MLSLTRSRPGDDNVKSNVWVTYGIRMRVGAVDAVACPVWYLTVADTSAADGVVGSVSFSSTRCFHW